MAESDRSRMEATKGEFLGRMITIQSASDPTLVGLTGEVLDETMKTITLRSAAGRRITVAKSGITLGLHMGTSVMEIDGNTLLFRPEDRIKKVRQARSTRQSR